MLRAGLSGSAPYLLKASGPDGAIHRGRFFVGASVFLQGGEDRPARVDTDGRADRSWFFYAPDIAAVIDSLAGAPFGTRMDDQSNVPFPGAFMIRAMGQPVVAAGEGPDRAPDEESDRRVGTGDDLP